MGCHQDPLVSIRRRSYSTLSRYTVRGTDKMLWHADHCEANYKKEEDDNGEISNSTKHCPAASPGSPDLLKRKDGERRESPPMVRALLPLDPLSKR